MTIAQQVAQMRQATADEPTTAARAAFTSEQEALHARGLPAGIAEPGTALPDARLIDVRGDGVSLLRNVAGHPAVVVFYRGAWCPYCNMTLRTYQRLLLPELVERQVSLVAISPQTPDGSLSMQEKQDLTFAVLSDAGNTVATALGITITPAEGVLAAQQEHGLDLTQVNADHTATIPMPTTLVVDAAGTIRWIDVHPDYTTRSEVVDILAAVDEVIEA